ncbi:uncharacterized protein LOC114245325 [Bombyx mandarina]|uniref:Uncharacterized protein LOC114245325 n=1 Tax=Bombyx mandarina TaxID=7092 RepID=A0A6J2JWM7_BOMMA|nr:uncharacterized protein LOC114245325 [Bombyx mandarina]
MISKLWRAAASIHPNVLVIRKVTPRVFGVRRMDLLPPNQYKIPLPRKLKLTYAMRVYWEIIPLVFTSTFSITLLFLGIAWSLTNKMDVVYSTHNRDNISRTMDLRNPSVHKVMLVNQRYEPWPEMQDVLDKMKMAEKRSLARAQTCNQS